MVVYLIHHHLNVALILLLFTGLIELKFLSSYQLNIAAMIFNQAIIVSIHYKPQSSIAFIKVHFSETE